VGLNDTEPVAGTAAGEQPLKVLVVEFLPSGGMFQFSYLFGEALAALGHQVTLLTGPSPELASRRAGFVVDPSLPTWHPNQGLETGGLRRKARRALRALQLVGAWGTVLVRVRRERPDVVQFGELRYTLDTAAFALVARFGGARAVVDVAHNPVPYDVTGSSDSVEKSGRLTRALLARAYAAADLVLVLGEGPRTELLRAFPGVRRTAVCGHGDYSALVRSEAADVLPSAAPPAALFFGAWTKYKDIPLLLDGFALVREELPEATLTLAGPVMPDVDLEEVRRRAEPIGGVDLRPGYVAIEDLPELFAQHRAVMFTYATVNISGSVHMAYTFGRPVVATRVGAMEDAVEDGVTGLLAEPTPRAVADAMLAVLGDPERADALGAGAREHAERSSTWSGVAEKAVAAYRETLAASHGR
jgi:glycosyltransferase involved in cell wall biosynthesis